MKAILMIAAMSILVCGGCRKKKTELKDEAIVEQKVLVNTNSINDINNSNIDVKLAKVEGKMVRIANSVVAMEPDSSESEIKRLIGKSTRGLKDARQDLNVVLREMDRNNIPKAEAKLEDIIADLGDLEQTLAAEGY